MKENNDIFLAGCWLSYFSVLGRTNAQKNIPQHLLGASHLVRIYLRTNFSTDFVVLFKPKTCKIWQP